MAALRDVQPRLGTVCERIPQGPVGECDVSAIRKASVKAGLNVASEAVLWLAYCRGRAAKVAALAAV